MHLDQAAVELPQALRILVRHQEGSSREEEGSRREEEGWRWGGLAFQPFPTSDAEEWVLFWGCSGMPWTLVWTRNFYDGHDQTDYSEGHRGGWMPSFLL